MDDLAAQINWIKKKFSEEAEKVRNGAKSEISYQYYDRLIANTERKFADHPDVTDLQLLKFEFGVCNKGYDF
ncbi:hypothetical protein F0241_19570 [Vibrio kanaloae]|uniref:hypothetical protein n=1 Tax=Vibrio kanaloae TaxID=170673 RepID=UPI00148D50D1|nr:hypothetical protein [Vibrio kanaloae]NOI03291.1 hypothetical protein [Vibrio kanaloae]HDM8038343.1 hypothetical protein [Vibrio fluvialis]